MVFLMGMSGPVKGQKYVIDRDQVTLGRRPDSDLPIDDPSASGNHCVLIREGARYTLRDLESTNGTLVNGKRVTEARLRAKDIIQIGVAELLFDGQGIEADARDEESPPTVELKQVSQIVPDSFQSASPFAEKRDYRKLWFGLIVAVGALAFLALAYFVYTLMKWS